MPRSVVPSKKRTVPPGTPTAGATAATVAVKVIGWLLPDGSGVVFTFTTTAPRTIVSVPLTNAMA